jgi:hypothetical protein
MNMTLLFLCSFSSLVSNTSLPEHFIHSDPCLNLGEIRDFAFKNVVAPPFGKPAIGSPQLEVSSEGISR